MRDADDLGHWRALAVTAFVGLGSLTAAWLAVGGPAWLSILGPSFASVAAALALVLLVAERRARRTERVGGDGRPGRAVAAGSHLSGRVVLDDVPVDALVVFLSYAREDDQW